tara:strand:+ start:1210 stop:1389 length:180 start_codon:yes stop_codon:yes gene_type:complete
MFATKNMMKNMGKKTMGMPEHLTTDMGGGKDEVIIPKPKIIQKLTGLKLFGKGGKVSKK